MSFQAQPSSLARSQRAGSVLTAAAFCAAAAAVPAAAQKALPPPAADVGDRVTLGLGVAATPSYEGSNSYVPIPAILVSGRVSGFTFFSRGSALYFDLAREPSGEQIDLLFGPMANLRIDRVSRVRDRVVERLGKLDTVVELGGFVGVGRGGLLNPYDYAQARVDFLHDVTGTHRGFVATPTVEYGTPLSTSVYVGASLSSDYASGEFADTYYSVTPAGSAASGLRRYDADAGFKNARLTLLGNYAFSGDLRRGLSAFGVASYSRLLGDFKDSPLVRDRGNANQFFVALGLAYTF